MSSPATRSTATNTERPNAGRTEVAPVSTVVKLSHWKGCGIHCIGILYASTSAFSAVEIIHANGARKAIARIHNGIPHSHFLLMQSPPSLCPPGHQGQHEYADERHQADRRRVAEPVELEARLVHVVGARRGRVARSARGDQGDQAEALRGAGDQRDDQEDRWRQHRWPGDDSELRPGRAAVDVSALV